ncbi:hypothetical protein [Peribacillus sp. NPDC060253]|uniref:hypothetical protein n=1 Tax=Peribacillus sp. NPDC060253 TaxID=3347084 RepID=UPI003647EFEB
MFEIYNDLLDTYDHLINKRGLPLKDVDDMVIHFYYELLNHSVTKVKEMSKEKEIGYMIVRVRMDGANFDKGQKNLLGKMSLLKSEMKASKS